MKTIRPAAKTAGFTLVELIIVITLTGVVAILASTIVGNQMLGYVDTSRRAALVGRAEQALRFIARDLRNAVPYSVRTNGTTLEWVPIESYGRYRRYTGSGAGDVLDFSIADDQFDVLGNVPNLATGKRLVIGNTPVAAAGFNLYESASTDGTHVITYTSTVLANAANQITLSPSFQFSQDSISARFYVVDGATSYICNTGSGIIQRYSDYSIQSALPTSAPASSVAARLLDTVSSCSFDYTNFENQGLVTVRLQLTESGETISLLRMIHIENRP